MEEYENKKLYTWIDENNISNKVMLIEDVIDLLKEHDAIKIVNQLEPPIETINGEAINNLEKAKNFLKDNTWTNIDLARGEINEAISRLSFWLPTRN